jgi:hypothetical protein
MPDQLAPGADHIVELLKGTDEQGVSRRGFRMAGAVGYGLPAARLVERDFDAEALQKRQRRYPNLRMEGIDLKRNKMADSHGSLLLGARSMVLSARAAFALENDVDHDGVVRYLFSHECTIHTFVKTRH